MKRLLLVLGALLAGGAGADAADLALKGVAPPPPAYTANWTAFYVGGYLGGSWGNANYCSFSFAGFACGDLKGNGAIGGAYVGYDYELPNRFVVGARISVPFFGPDATGNEAAVLLPPAGRTLSGSFNWAVLANVIFGYDMGPWMPYAGVGFAFASVDAHINGPFAVTSATEQQAGLNVLVGLKYALTRNWALGVQYNHTEFARTSYNFTGPALGATGTIPIELSQNSLVATADYRF